MTIVHGHRTTKRRKRESATYATWRGMIQRCMNPKHRSYKHYGAKGVRVYFGWLTGGGGFPQFLADMGERPSRWHTLDRKDADGHYDPANCRWRTIRQQNQGLLYRGAELVGEFTLEQHARRLGIKYHSLLRRIRNGFGERAFTQPGRAA